MKVIKVDQVTRESHPGPLFTGPVTMQPIVGKELSKKLLIMQVNFGPGWRDTMHGAAETNRLEFERMQAIFRQVKGHAIEPARAETGQH